LGKSPRSHNQLTITFGEVVESDGIIFWRSQLDRLLRLKSAFLLFSLGHDGMNGVDRCRVTPSYVEPNFGRE
jgi:hypothetical protein